jgi:hypothetical protein
MNVSALDICLATHEEQYDKVLHLVSDFKGYHHSSSKIRRRVSQSHITALQVCLPLYRNYAGSRKPWMPLIENVKLYKQTIKSITKNRLNKLANFWPLRSK